MPHSRPIVTSVAVIGNQPEALLLSVLFAEAGIPNFLVGSFEPIPRNQSTGRPLDEARWLLGLHTLTGRVTLLPSIHDLPLGDVQYLFLTAQTGDPLDSFSHERTMRSIAKGISRGSNIVCSGLSKPGHVAAIAEAIHRFGGVKAGGDLGLCYLPLLWNGESLKSFKETPRIMAGPGSVVQKVQELLLRVFPMISSTRKIRAAEAAGLFSPIYREVVGALEQELARFCVAEQVDFLEALGLCRGVGLSALASARPFPGRDSIGSEIALSSSTFGGELRLIRAARRVNQECDQRVVGMVKNALALCGHRIRHSRIAVLGLDGLGVNNRLDHEPIRLFQTLKRRGASLSVYPGNCSAWTGRETFGENVRVEHDITRAVEKAHCALVALSSVDNGELNPGKLAAEMSRPAAICDLTRVLEASNVERAGLLYTAMGRGRVEA